MERDIQSNEATAATMLPVTADRTALDNAVCNVASVFGFEAVTDVKRYAAGRFAPYLHLITSSLPLSLSPSLPSNNYNFPTA